MSGGAALWGAGSALVWGVSDYSARFAGERVGVLTASLGMMLVGLVATVIYIVVAGIDINWTIDGAGYLIGGGVGIAVGTVVLYEALTRGPVSVASPVVASYPAMAVPISIAMGTRPGVLEWVAMAATMVGVWIVARWVRDATGTQGSSFEPANIRRTTILALTSAAVFALAITAIDLAVDIYGPPVAVLGMRAVGIICFACWFLVKRQIPRVPLNAIWLLVFLGMLDTMGHLFLYMGLESAHGEFAVVASAAYTVVTVLLARIFLREPVNLPQWGGIAIVVAGIGSLAVLG